VPIAEIRTADDFISYFRANGFLACDLKFCDLLGRWRHVTVPAGRVTESLFSRGVGFDGSSVPGFATTERGDMLLVPDPSSAFVDPFFNEPTLSMICDCRLCGSGEPFSRDPRYIARKAERYLGQMREANQSFWLPEFEFNLFSSASFYEQPSGSGYWLRCDEQGSKDGKDALPNVGNASRYHTVPPNDRVLEVRAKIVSEILRAGVDVKYHHHEVGPSGQCEIEIMFDRLLATADNILLVKYLVRNTARSLGMTASFLPKPLFGEAGNGLHFHQYLRLDGEPVFYAKGNYADLSQLALYYIGGMLKHGRSLLALTSPSTNSYRRLVPGYEAPTNLFFSSGNRSAAIRVPLYADTAQTKCIEFRPPDATCNPYLAMAAMLMAGLDGINNKIDPGKEGFGPIDEDITKLSSRRLKKILPVPETLGEALDALEDDNSYLLEGGVFTEDVIRVWIDYKLEHEVKPVSSRPHPHEVALYFDL